MIFFFYFLAGYLGGILCLLDAFGLETLQAGILAFAAGYSLMFGSLYRMRRAARYTLPITACGYGILAVINFEKIAEGWKLLLYIVNRTVLQYTGASERAQELTEGQLASVGVCLLFVLFLMGALLFYGAYVREGKAFAVFYSSCMIGVLLAVGGTPGLVPACLLIFFCLGITAGSDVQLPAVRRKALILIGCIGAISLILAQYAAVPLLTPAFSEREQVKERLQKTSLFKDLLDRLPEITGGMLGKGGLGEGDLTGNDGFLFSGQTALEVKIKRKKKPEETVYLRGYVGTEYTGARWNAEPDPEWEELGPQLFTFREQMGLAWNLLPVTMEVKIVGADKKYTYAPYYSDTAQEMEEGGYRYTWLPREESDGKINALQQGSYFSSAASVYSAQRLQSYLAYPQEGTEGLRGIVRANPQADVDSVTEFIVNLLASEAKYNLQVGRFPQGVDFAEYFLTEAREGYCIHFATTAALLFRMYGIPSRYVEGYIAPAADFKSEEGAYVAEVTDERAHAWVEIFRVDLGWVPVEATPGFAQAPAEEQGETNVQPQTRPQSEQQTPSTERETQQAEQKEGEGAFGQWLAPALLFISSGLGLTLLILQLRRRYIQKRRQKAGAAKLFPSIYRALVIGGWKEETDCQDARFAAALAAKFPWIEEEEMQEVMEIVMRANYGKDPVTEGENRRVQHMYRLIAKRVYEELSLWKRIWARYGQVL